MSKNVNVIVAVAACLCEGALFAEWARPGLVAKVAAGEIREAHASWWGFDKEDSTVYLQAAIDSGVPKLVVDNMPSPWIVTPIKAVSNQHIVFEKGTVLLAKRGEFVGRNDRLLSVNEVENVRITGYGATLRMWRADYAKGKDGKGRDYRRGEWRHTLSINGSRNVVVEGLTLEESGGDGIYISSKTAETTSRDIVIRDCVCDRNHRQGLSVISARNLLVENCVFKNTRGVAPEDGVDFEPNNAGEHFVNCVLRNCVSENNAGNGFEFALMQSRASTEPCSVVIENCRSTGDRFGMKISTRVKPEDGGYPKGSLAFKGCTFEKCRHHAIDIKQNPEGGVAVSFADCTFRQIGTTDPDAPLVCLESVFLNDPKPAMPKITGLVWSDRGNRSYASYDTMNFAVLGEETLPFLPADTAGAEVVDRSPGEMVKCSHVRFRHRVRLVAYADRARRVTIRGEQVRVGPPTARPTKQPVKVCDASGNVVATIPLVDFGPSDLSFDAPAVGFYSLEVMLGGHSYVVTETDVPLAADGSLWVYRHEPAAICLISPEDALHVPIKAGARAEFRVQGSLPNEKVWVRIADPAGKTVFDRDVLYWTHYLAPASAADGLWKLTFNKPRSCAFEDVSVILAGIRPFLFLSPEKYWLSEDAVPFSRYRFDAGSDAPKLFYDAYRPIESGSNAEIAIVLIHGWGGHVRTLLPVFTAALSARAGSEERTPYVIAPQFPRRETIASNKEPEDGRAVWCDSWANEDRHPDQMGSASDDWRGGGDANGTSFSSYDYIDAIFARFADRVKYPNLRKVVLAGFSAGGQFAGRYAATGKGVVRDGVKVVYVAMSPSTEFMFEPGQPWLYGLDGRPRYSAALTEAEIMKNLCSRRVWRGCGSLDILGRPKTSLDMTPPAAAQGANRYERFKNFERYLDKYPEWKKQVSFHVFEGVAHKEDLCYPDSALLDFVFE